jgi:tetratricopeptide (TPR) repeat protein
MSTPTPNDTFEFAEHSPHNEAALEELTSAVAFGQGADTITLLLVRCNYGDLRERMVAALVARLAAEDLDGPIHTLRLAPQDSNLYAQVRAVAAEQRPGAVLVLGTEGVDALDVLLVEMNKRREEFRRDFPFPLVLWFTDDGYRQLSNYANDFESIVGGETIEFRLDQATLTQQLQGAAQRLFDALLAQDRPEFFNRRLIGLDLGCLSPGEVAIALADLQAQGADLSLDLQATLAFAQGLNIPNEEAIARFDQSAAQWQTLPAPRAALKRGLALVYLGRARYFAADNDKYQSPDWTPAVAPLQAALGIFEQAQRPDLMAQGMIPLARVLHRLEQWDDLEVLIQRAIPLHEAHSSPDRLAQDYGFLADVALHRGDWPQAATLAQRALDTSTASWWQILYLKLLAQAQQAQGQIAAATANLQAAQALGVMDHPKLHSDVLGLLQQCLRAQGRYLDAFEVKRERLAVEQQYGLRAFIGAGRLRSRRTEQRATVQSQRRSTEAVAPEIAASGRQRNLDELLKRIAGKEHKLIVLHGDSGVGKSSLVNGGLLPALQGRALDNRDNIPVLLRQYTDWARELAQRLTAALEIQNSKFKVQSSEGGSQESEVRSQESEARSQKLGVRSQEPSSPTHPPFDFAQGRPAYPSTHTLLATLRECEDYTLRPVLIFDQFEEFFFAKPDPVDRRVFFEFVVACLELQPSALKIVLSLREDYIHYLLEARQAVRRSALPPGSMARSQLEDILGKQILYGIGNFSPEDATAIINSLAAGSRMYLEPALINALVTDLAGPLQEVRPIEMQIVGAQLQTEGIQTLAQYRRLGDQPKETLVQRYLQDVVEDCGEEHRQLAELVLFLLTDERGTRPLKTRPELVRDLEDWGVPSEVDIGALPLTHQTIENGNQKQRSALDLVLYILCGSGIVADIPESPDDHYQLVHDYLAGVIHDRQAPQLKVVRIKLAEEKRRRSELEKARKRLASRLQRLRTQRHKLAHEKHRIRKRLISSSILLIFSILGVVPSLHWTRLSRQQALLAEGEKTALELQRNFSTFSDPPGTVLLKSEGLKSSGY